MRSPGMPDPAMPDPAMPARHASGRWVLAALLALMGSFAQAACPSSAWSREALLAWKADSGAQLDADRRDAVASQVVPASGHAYVFGEPERLARPLLFIARRGLHDEADWSAWFASLSSTLDDKAVAWKDAGWLAKRHDLAAFLRVLYLEADLSQDPGIVKLRPGILAGLKALP